MATLVTGTAVHDLSEEEIKSLAALAAQDDRDAFADLYRLYHPQLFQFIDARVGIHQEAEDLTSMVFEKALSAIDRYRPMPAQFSTWLYTIARNCVIDYYRKRRLPMQEESEAVRVPTSSPGENPEAYVLMDERRRRLHAAVRELTEEQRQVLGCRFFFNLSVQEVAEILDKTQGAVKALQFRALDSLQRRLTRDLGEE